MFLNNMFENLSYIPQKYEGTSTGIKGSNLSISFLQFKEIL